MKELSNELQGHYGQLLGIESPWQVRAVKLEMAHKRVEIEIGWTSGEALPCPECRRECAMKDYAPERRWRHLDVMRFETLLRCRVPRSDCPEHGVKTLRVPWAAPGSRFTLLFEAFAIDVLLACRSLVQAKELLGLHGIRSRRSWSGRSSGVWRGASVSTCVTWDWTRRVFFPGNLTFRF